MTTQTWPPKKTKVVYGQIEEWCPRTMRWLYVTEPTPHGMYISAGTYKINGIPTRIDHTPDGGWVTTILGPTAPRDVRPAPPINRRPMIADEFHDED